MDKSTATIQHNNRQESYGSPRALEGEAEESQWSRGPGSCLLAQLLQAARCRAATEAATPGSWCSGDKGFHEDRASVGANPAPAL